MLLVKNDLVKSIINNAHAKCLGVTREGYILQRCDPQGVLMPECKEFTLRLKYIRICLWEKINDNR